MTTPSGFGGRVSVPLYLGGGLQAEIKVRTAEQKEAVADYGRAGPRRFPRWNRRCRPRTRSRPVSPASARGLRVDRRSGWPKTRTAWAPTTCGPSSAADAAVQRQECPAPIQSEQLVQRINLHLALAETSPPPVPELAPLIRLEPLASRRNSRRFAALTAGSAASARPWHNHRSTTTTG